MRWADAARDAGEVEWQAGFDELAQLDGREWLLLDRAARWHRHGDGTPVSGVRGWLGPQLGESTGFVAAVTSLHVDGRIRERATSALASKPSRVAAPASAVRLLDHVPQVRRQAWTVLSRLLGSETAAPVLDVLLSARDRLGAAGELDRVAQHLLTLMPEATLLGTLMGDHRRVVRRWAFGAARDRGLLSTEALVAAALSDPDQWVQSSCADWLMAEPDTRRLRPILTSTSVEARLVALTRVEDLDAQSLERLLLDRAPRVREQARWRARRGGLDLASFYRQRISARDAAPREVAACLEGLVEAGDASDDDTFVRALRHPSSRVRGVAVAAVADRPGARGDGSLLGPTLLDRSPRVAVAAARALSRLGVSPRMAEEAWAAERPENRRAAWRLARSAGGWDRVTADLRAAADPDPGLASLGRTGVANWLVANAATTYERPTREQIAQVENRLGTVGLSEQQQRLLAFCAGIAR